MTKREVVSEFELRRVYRMLATLYIGLLKPQETFTISLSSAADWLSMQWELADQGRTRVYPVVARIDLKRSKLSERQAIDLLYDFFGERFMEHLQDDRQPFSGPDWESVDFAGTILFVRGQMWQLSAEDAATALLVHDAVERSKAWIATGEVEFAAGPDGDDELTSP